MTPRTTRLLPGTLLGLALLSAVPAFGQTAQVSLSGTVTDASGTVVANARVTAKNVTTGQSVDTQTNDRGVYSLPNLTPGDYEVTVSARGFMPKTLTVKAAAAAAVRTLDVTLNQPSGETPPLSLSDLGFQASELQGSAEDQARLDRRSHMLKVHQRLGLITAAPMVATVIAGTFAGGRRASAPGGVTASSATGRQVHAVLGAATAGLYFTTASYAIFAPKVPGTRVRGPIRWHRALAWVHGTGMVITPVLGVMAYRQRSRGERVHGLASFHGPAGVVTAAAYGAAILSVSVKF